MRLAILPCCLLLACSSDPAGPPEVPSDTAEQAGEEGSEGGGEEGGGEGSDAGGDEGGGDEEGGDEGGGDGLNGLTPDPAIPLPEFVATNLDGTGRGPEDFVGDPTIIWFFRDAGSAG